VTRHSKVRQDGASRNDGAYDASAVAKYFPLPCRSVFGPFVVPNSETVLPAEGRGSL
jgi:hypothetical protein